MSDTLGFWANAEEDPTWTALVAPDGTELTAGELLARSNQAAHAFRSLGLTRGDVVAVVLPNSVEFLVAYMGALQVGLYFTPINTHLVASGIAYIVNDSGAKVLITHESYADEIARATELFENLPKEGRLSVGEIEGFSGFDALLDQQPTTAPEHRSSGAPMQYTSGTTGNPKGVKRELADGDPSEIYSLYSMYLMLFGVQRADDNVHICGSPLYHTAVLVWASNSLHMKHKVVLMDKWEPEEMLRLIDKHQVTTSHMVPTQFHRLLQLPKEVRDKYDVSSTRTMVHAAAPCPPDIKRQMIEWWGDSIWEYYAASEGGGTIVTAAEWMKKYEETGEGTVGKAWTGSDVKIFDEDANELGPGEVGTVYMLLGQAAFEYKGDEKKTKSNRIGEFFTVGDVGMLDEEGYLFLRDRKIDMIISGGVNIYPAQIEAGMLKHPAVGDVAAFGVPNDDWGEEVKVVIQPAEGHSESEELRAELFSHAERELARHERPRSIDFIEEMPRDPSGKLYKRKLRDPYWKGKQRAI